MSLPFTTFTSRTFRELLMDSVPEAFVDETLGRLMHELLFPRWRDRWSGRAVLSHELLAELEGQITALRGKRYNGRALLDRFQTRTGLHLEITEADWLRGQARTAQLTLPPGLEAALSAELRILHRERRDAQWVNFLTGQPAAKQQFAEQRTARRKARLQLNEAPNVQLLNATPLKAYARFAPFFDQALEVADSHTREGRRHANLRTLHVLSQLGLAPTYRTATRSPRIYPVGYSMAQLSANVRATLLATSYQCDLVGAQLAIIARLWTLPTWTSRLQAAQQSGTALWPALLRELALPGDAKADLKMLVYATAYGMSQINLRRVAAERLGAEVTATLFRQPLMQELLAGRRERRNRLQHEGGITDALGQKVTVEDRRQQQGQGGVGGSLLAHEAQSFELVLLEPVFDIARRSEGFRIPLWLHDGCYVTPREDRAAQILRGLRDQVNRKAERLGIETQLEITYCE